MNNIIQSLRVYFILSMVIIVTGCSSMDNHRVAHPEPEDRLSQLLSLYKQASSEGKQCREIWKTSNAIIDCDRIIREVERLHIEFPNNKRILFAVSIINYDTGNKDKARFYLDQLLSMSNIQPNVALLRSNIAFEEGNITLSKSILTRQIMVSPENAELYEALAASYYTEGKYDKAREALNTAGRLGASGWRISYHHGLLHEASENWSLACDFYDMSLQQNKNYRPAKARLIGLGHHKGCIG